MNKPKKEYSELEVLLDVPYQDYQDYVEEILEIMRQTAGMYNGSNRIFYPPPQEPEDE